MPFSSVLVAKLDRDLDSGLLDSPPLRLGVVDLERHDHRVAAIRPTMLGELVVETVGHQRRSALRPVDSFAR